MDVWGGSAKCFRKKIVEGLEFFQVANVFLQRRIVQERTRFVRTARKLWLGRKGLVFNGTFENPTVLLHEVEDAEEEYQRLLRQDIKETHPVEAGVVKRWTAPKLGYLKTNWEAALNSKKGLMGVGILIRDTGGNVYGAKSLVIQGQLEATAAEALAVFHAVRFSQEMGAERLLLEGDAMNVLTAVNSKNPHMLRYGQLIEDTKSLLSLFPDWECHHVTRECNTSAHGFTKEACKQVIESPWMFNVLRRIRDIVLTEQSTLSSL